MSAARTSPQAQLTVAVVGHTNTGKTSLMRTLLHDVAFGEVSDRPAVTREVAGAALLVDSRPLVKLFDTPGLEDSSALRDHLENLRAGQRMDGPDLIEQFLGSAEAAGPFAQEAKALRQVLASDAALYVIDARDPVLGKHRDELAILNMCARPIVPVLNFLCTPEARLGEWRKQLSRAALHAVAEFDTVVIDEHSEQRLFEKMRTLLDGHRATLDALIEDRRRQRRRIIDASARLVAEMLIDAAAFTITIPANDPAAVKAGTQRLREAIRRREQQAVQDLLNLHRFHPDDAVADDLPLEGGRWGMDLFSPEALKHFGIRAGSGAAAGAMAGAAADVALGGLSLGAFAATGAAIGAAASTGATHGRRLLDRLRGHTELRCDDATLKLLEARQVTLIGALLARGHASQQQLHVRAPGAASGAASGKPAEPLRLARTRPRWSTLSEGGGSPAAQSDPGPFRVTGRAAAVDRLATMIARTVG